MNRKNIGNGLFIIFICLILFVPQAKALVIQGLMQIGLFNPTLKVEKDNTANKPLLIFKDIHGKLVELESLKGKVVFINFWATWCPPCLAEMPAINKLYQRYEKDAEVVFVMIDADSDFSKSQAYMDKKKYKLPVYIMASNVPEQLFTGSLPTTIVLDKQGRLAYKEEGAANYASQKFINFIEKLKALKN